MAADVYLGEYKMLGGKCPSLEQRAQEDPDGYKIEVLQRFGRFQ